MTEWREMTLGDVLKVHHGYAFKGEHFSDDGPDVLLTPKNFRAAGGLDTSPGRCKRYSGPVDSRFVLKADDIVLAMTDLKQDAPILGAAGRVPLSGRYLHNQRIGRVEVIDEATLSPTFVPWLLNSHAVRSQVRATATGATVRHTAPERIEAVVTMVPSTVVQRRIAAALDAFDELIAINERRIALLEDLARSLYREWFLRFRFPGHGRECEPPLDWSGFRIADLAEVVTDGVGPTDVPHETPYLGLEHLPRRSTTLREWGSTASVTSRKLRFQAGDTLFGKIRPYFHKVVWSPFDGVASSDAIVFRVSNGVRLPGLLTTMLSSDALVAEAVATSNGTKMPRADAKAILNYRVILPPLDGELIRQAEKALRATYDLAANLAFESIALVHTRDLLLPRLVTGRLDISDANLGALLPEEIAA
jgi:type I restriction enzyme S subunit